MTALANTREEYVALGILHNSGFIGTVEAWVASRTAKHGLLAVLSEAALDEFSQSAIFEDGILKGAKIKMVGDELGEEGLLDFVALFGISPSRFVQTRHGYWNVKKNYCVGNQDHICGMVA